MAKPLLLVVLFFMQVVICSLVGCARPAERIAIIDVSPSENTGQDYSAWLTDNINALVPNCWTPSNFKYVDVKLDFATKCKITLLSLYDFEGIFNDNPASIYAVNGDTKTLIGTFKGEKYKAFVDMVPKTPILADAIIIHKYANNFPQKIRIFGAAYGTNPETQGKHPEHATINFENFENKSVGDAPFKLIARSTNTRVPLTFVASDSAILSVNKVNGEWIATIKKAGTVRITVSQAGADKFLQTDSGKTLIVHPDGFFTAPSGKIPIDAKRWIQLTNASSGLDKLFDGKIDSEVNTGWGKILENYDSYYPVARGEQIDLSGAKFYDGQGTNTAQPMTLSVITEDGQRITVGRFTGTKYNTWVGPDTNYPDSFNFQTTFTKIKYIVINSWNFFPTEMELYGNYVAGSPPTPAIKNNAPLKQLFGANGFEWNFEAPTSPGQIDPQRLKSARSLSGLRHYLDWGKLEAAEGSYSFNPAFDGGWNYDALYDSCKSAGIEVLACIKTLPTWMLNTYPAADRDPENTPVKYGKDFSNPASYIEQAKLGFQYAARYGNNQSVNRSLLSVNSKPRWAGDQVNTVKVGLNLIHYIECDNERDKWWKGRKAYQTAFEYAANLSAFYDGNKNTMGQGVGVKNADSSMKVVMAGTAASSTDYLRGMVEWCRLNRGYNADGSVNLCWDVINYHFYSNDSKNSQNGKPTRGSAPELSGTDLVARAFIQTAHDLANDMPVWVTELGYDLNQGSPFKAIPIAGKTPMETQADWLLRSSLLYSREGIDRIFFYMLYDDNADNALQFSSSGLLNSDLTNRPVAAFSSQVVRLFGNYRFTQTLNTSPHVDEYALNGQLMYAVFVPDEKGKTATYTLDLVAADSAKIYTPKNTGDLMTSKTMVTNQGKISVTATETPIFVIPVKKGVPPGNGNTDTSNNADWSNTVKIYPNPASNVIYIDLNNSSTDKVGIRLVQASTGAIFENISKEKNTATIQYTLNVENRPDGYYFVEVSQGKNKKSVKLFKRRQ